MVGSIVVSLYCRAVSLWKTSVKLVQQNKLFSGVVCMCKGFRVLSTSHTNWT